MENTRPTSAHSGQSGQSPTAPSEVLTHKRSISGGGILSRFPFIRSSESKASLKEPRSISLTDNGHQTTPPRAMAEVAQQQKTRKRKGSLRKVALLGRGAQRERKETKPLAIPPPIEVHTTETTVLPAPADEGPIFTQSPVAMEPQALGLAISDDTPRPSTEGFARRVDLPTRLPPPIPDVDSQVASPTMSYTSTTDEEEGLSLKVRSPSPARPGMSSINSSGSESYYPKPARSLSVSLQRRRSVKHAKSPLSLQGLTASPLPDPDADHDYSETEWWGWVVLVVTWTVFVVGMGSCLGVWTWAWDVGTTPYAPPELENDPTLPIVGYYPSLIILTCIMAWVWVVTAWVGMKYFRHAKISGD